MTIDHLERVGNPRKVHDPHVHPATCECRWCDLIPVTERTTRAVCPDWFTP